jgi:FkbM family methyltransferase
MKLFGNARTQYLLIKELQHDPYLIKKIPTNSMGFFVDIGAQAGIVSVMFRLWNRKTQMYAVEPDPVAYDMLKDNVSNLEVVTLNKALGDGSSFALNPPEKRTTRGVEYVEAKEGFVNLVKSERLTDLLTELNRHSTVDIKPSETMFKIDCEGGEAYIIDHAPSLNILKEARMVAFELHKGKRTLEEYFNAIEMTYSDTHRIVKIKQNEDRSANWTLIRKDVKLG